MDINVIQILLILVITFIAAIDQFSFLESLYQPIVMGPLVGLILGDLQTGLIIGGSYQLMMIGSMPVGGAQPPNAVIGGIMATVFAITMNIPDPQAALGLSIPFALLGQYSVILVFTITSPLMAKADKMAENADTNGIERLNYFTMGMLGLFFTVVVFFGLIFGQAIGETLTNALPEWVWTGLGTAGGMMRFVGFAVLMKVMLSREYWGFYLAGFALANIIAPTLGGQALALIAIIGLAVAIYDFQTNVKMRELAEGGNGDGI
ncbi:PTS sugar transporter subunit IIC [Mycoplasmatota bacterium WC44]